MLVLPLHQPIEVAPLEVGSFVSHLQPLLATRAAITPGIIIPISTLRLIAESCQLETKLAGLLSPHVPVEHVAHVFTQLPLPREVSRELLHAYHDTLAEWPVHIIPSWVHAPIHPVAGSSPVKGDAVVLETMFREWGTSTWTAAQRHSLQPWLSAAIVIQAAPTSQAIITVETKSSAGEKTAHVKVTAIKTHPQVFDHYEVDVRTWEITTRLLEQAHRPLVSDNVITDLAHQTYEAKRRTLHHLRCEWQLLDKKWVVTKCEPHLIETLSYPSVAHQKSNLVGESAVAGSATGTVVQTGATLQNIPGWREPTVLVTQRLDRITSHHLHNLSAVVCEQGVSNQVFTLLRQFAIPTITNARYATRLLQPHQRVMVNADAGTVTTASATTPPSDDISSPCSVVSWLDEHDRVPEMPIGFRTAGFVLQSSHLRTIPLLPGTTQTNLTNVPHTWINLDWLPTRHSSHLQQQLEQIRHAQQKLPYHPHVVSPVMHAPLEAEQFLKHVLSTGFQDEWPIWWHIQTPENMLNVATYIPILKPRGCIISLTELAYYLTGIQFWDASIAAQYPFPIGLLHKYLQRFITEHQDIVGPVFFKIHTPSTALLTLATQLRVAGVMVSSYHVADTYRTLSDLTNADSATNLWQ